MAKYKSMAADLGWDGENKPIQPSTGKNEEKKSN